MISVDFDEHGVFLDELREHRAKVSNGLVRAEIRLFYDPYKHRTEITLHGGFEAGGRLYLLREDCGGWLGEAREEGDGWPPVLLRARARLEQIEEACISLGLDSRHGVFLCLDG